VAAVRDEPQVRPRDRRAQLERQRDRIQGIAVAEHDQRVGRHSPQGGRREAHVVVAVCEAARDREELLDLRLATAVNPAQALQLGRAHRLLREARLQRARLRGKVGRGAHGHHRLHAARMRRGHVQADDAAAAQSDRLDVRELQVPKQTQQVRCALPERERPRRIRRAPVAAQVGRDDAVAGGRLPEDVAPVGPASRHAVEEQQGLALPRLLPVQLDPVELDLHARLLGQDSS
jgi:hypothetical protein